MIVMLAERLSRCADVQSVLDCALDGSLEISGAHAGNAQLMDWGSGHLHITAQRGFYDEFLNFFERVEIKHASACARALRHHHPIIIEDVAADHEFAPCLEIARRAGIRAVQSTPLISSSGALVGILSTHFSIPHRPTDLQMQALKEIANVTANTIIRLKASARAWTPLNSLNSLFESWKAVEHAESLLVRSRSARIN